MKDLVERQAAIRLFEKLQKSQEERTLYQTGYGKIKAVRAGTVLENGIQVRNQAEILWTRIDGYLAGLDDAIVATRALPSEQPEIILCKDCKYRDENWRRVAVKWLPCMEIRMRDNWYCGSAERRTDG